jgi:hypothetical protein
MAITTTTSTSTTITAPAGSSFKELKEADPPRHLIAAIDGLPREGRTHFSLTAPYPLAYMQMDPGGDDVLPKFLPGGPFHRSKSKLFHSAYYVDVRPGLSPLEVSKIANDIWLRSAQDFEAALKTMRTLVVDTASEWFTCLKLARFGKLTQVMPEDYGPVYAEFRRLIRKAYNYECNVLLLHKLKDEYTRDEKTTDGSGNSRRKPGKKTGNLVRDGWNGLKYEVQIEARCFKDEDREFCLEVVNCRQRPELDGEVLPQEMCNFQQLAMQVYPGTKESDWR